MRNLYGKSSKVECKHQNSAAHLLAHITSVPSHNRSFWKSFTSLADSSITSSLSYLTDLLHNNTPSPASVLLMPSSCQHHSGLSSRPGATENSLQLPPPAGALSSNTSQTAVICCSENYSKRPITGVHLACDSCCQTNGFLLFVIAYN